MVGWLISHPREQYRESIKSIEHQSAIFYNKRELTCALGSRYVGARLVSEQQSAIIGAGVDIADWHRAGPVTTVVRERHGSTKRAGHGYRLLPEHRIEQGISCDVRAQRWQGVSAVAVSCNDRWKLKINLRYRFRLKLLFLQSLLYFSNFPIPFRG